MKSRVLLIIVSLASLLGAFAYQTWKSLSLDEVPKITVVTTSGQRIALRELRGKPLLVTFWATTCASCMEEMPHLIDLYKEFSPQGLNIIGIAVHYDPPNRVLAVQTSHHIPYTIAIDIDARASRAFGDVELTPTTFLIAPDGRVVYRKSGHMDMDKVRHDIMAMLGSSRAAQPASTPGGS